MVAILDPQDDLSSARAHRREAPDATTTDTSFPGPGPDGPLAELLALATRLVQAGRNRQYVFDEVAVQNARWRLPFGYWSDALHAHLNQLGLPPAHPPRPPSPPRLLPAWRPADPGTDRRRRREARRQAALDEMREVLAAELAEAVAYLVERAIARHRRGRCAG
jgi:hypothetical protein